MRQVAKISGAEENTKQDFRKLSFFMNDEEVCRSLKVYYCTEQGKVKGELQISQSRIFFDPSPDVSENTMF